MPTDHRAALASISRFDQLIAYLRDEMGWPIKQDSFEDVNDLFFDFTPDELGIDSRTAAKIQSIKRLRPMSPRQPWGIFFVKFEPKRLPVVALRRILSQVALKKRASANKADHAAWAVDDLLFISNFGEGDQRQISFAHFSQERPDELPSLQVLGWDNLDTPLHLDEISEALTEKLAWPTDESDVATWREAWRSAFTIGYREVITTSRVLAVRLAQLARMIRDRIRAALAIETENGRITRLMAAFRDALIHDLTPDDFADMYAQTIAYGLLSARIVNPGASLLNGAAFRLPVTNPFLKELMEAFLNPGTTAGSDGQVIDFDELGVSEVVAVLDGAKMEAVIADFGDRNPHEDPVIHFYELFLKEYDAKKRMQRGVFYTPRPVVSYIVRAVDELLRTEFGLADGLADTATWGEMALRNTGFAIPEGIEPSDRFVTVLDPATGTGTFLVETIEVIHRTVVDNWRREGHGDGKIADLWNDYVPRHLLPRLHGFELLMAPYAIAHLKVGLKLHETGYLFNSEERARIYLTNSVEPPNEVDQMVLEGFLPALAHEARAVNEVKEKQRFTVVIGNPPYSIVSANSGQWIVGLCEAYKTTVRTRERQIQALSDDYVKFLRLAHWQLERSAAGVFGMITNNGYLNGHLFVDMRAALREAFKSIRLLDLHGNLRTHELTPQGKPDDNVFDIQTGVAIAFGVRTPSSGEHHVAHADLWGSRGEKYVALTTLDLDTTEWRELELSTPSEPWVVMTHDAGREWDQMVSLVDVFGTGNRQADAQRRYAAGFVSQQDDFAIAFSPEDILARVRLLLDPATNEQGLRQQFDLCTTMQWSFDRAREELANEDVGALVTECSYRPFDTRYTVFHRGVVSILRKELMRHLLHQDNVALLATRGISRQTFAHVFAAKGPVDRHALDNASESMFVFPLLIYPQAVVDGTTQVLFPPEERVLNIAPGFLADLNHQIATDQTPLPEQILGFIYAVLHDPAYRSRYADHLALDFPRIPLPVTSALFGELAHLGSELIALHLMESRELDKPITTYIGPSEPEVRRIAWSDDTVWLDAGRGTSGQTAPTGTVGFRGVSEGVWNFHIGGYQVCHKWLKDRRGRTLSHTDISHYQRIIVATAETIRIMEVIDAAIEANGGWPGAFQGAEVGEELRKIAEAAPAYDPGDGSLGNGQG